MSYTFKNMADVELLGAMPENANVFVEVDGSTKRAPQVNVDVAGELAVTEALEEVPEGATVLAEVNGEIKRVPSAGLGGNNDTWDIVIRNNVNTGEYYWAKGDAATLIEMLMMDQPPRVCVYSANNDIGSPWGFATNAVNIEVQSSSGPVWIYITLGSGIRLNINSSDGTIEEQAPPA